MERKINVIEKQNADKDTSQLSVGKHIPHKPQSQSIYHTAVNPLCVCLCVHVVQTGESEVNLLFCWPDWLYGRVWF